VFLDAGAVPHDGFSEPTLSIQREVRRLRQRTLPFIGHVIAISNFIRTTQSLPDRGHDDGVATLLCGGDHLEATEFDPENSNAKWEQKFLQQLDDHNASGYAHILALGRFEDQGYKNSPMLFDILRLISKEVSKIKLIILVGSESINAPKDLGSQVIAVNTLTDWALRQIMGRCALGISPSLWEGFNLPIAEMQFVDRPVLAFNVGAHPEVIADPWFLCMSGAEMARKAVRILKGRLPQAIAVSDRLGAFRKRHVWAERVSTWAAKVESAAILPRNKTSVRRLVLVDVTNSARDPANSGVIRVTRKLTATLSRDPDIVILFVIWDDLKNCYCILHDAAGSQLGTYGGPTDWVGVVSKGSRYRATVEQLLASADPRSARAPVLFCPEVILDGTSLQRVKWARDRRMRVAFILYDLLPVYEPQYVDPNIVSVFPRYLESLQLSDAVWAISNNTLIDFDRYCSDKGYAPLADRAAVWLPGQFGDSARVTNTSPPTGIETRILCVATIEPRKNHRVLISAFKLLQQRRPDLPIRLILIGNSYDSADGLTEWLRDVQRNDSQIEWKGVVSDKELEWEYSRASFTVYPSLCEGFGLPILESLWLGRPCVCHEDGVMGELAAEGGCLMLDLRSADELACGIERLITDTEVLDALARQTKSRQIGTWRQYGNEISRRLNNI
jgi:glycosyltransferase involved in cell wall biosynthesis